MFHKLIFVLLFLVPLHYAGITQLPDEVKMLRINPDVAMGGTVAQYIDSVSFIMLESNAKSEFGSISKLKVTDKYFIILDEETNALLIFTKDGLFHAKIEGRKFLNNLRIYQFNYLKESGLIEIKGYLENLFFDLNGKLVKKEPFQDNSEWRFGQKIPLGQQYEAYQYRRTDKKIKADTTAKELMITKDGKLKHAYFPYSKKYPTMLSEDEFGFQRFFPTKIDSIAFFIRSYDYTVYKLTPHSIYMAYQFILPAQYTLPPAFATDSSYNGKRIQFIINNKNHVYKIDNFFEFGSLIFFKAIKSYVFDAHQQKLVCINHIVSDSLSSFLPITDAEVGGNEFMNTGMLDFDGQYFYTSYSSLRLFQQMEATKNKKAAYPEKLAAYFNKASNKKGNPVIVQLKFKPAL